MTNKNYQFYECPVVFDLGNERYDKVCANIEGIFEIERTWVRPFICKCLNRIGGKYLGSYDFVADSIAPYCSMITLAIVDKAENSDERIEIFNQIVELYRKNPKVEVMMPVDNDIATYFQNIPFNKNNK